MESLRLILIRHGETLENASSIVQGHHHGSLSSIGKKQTLLITSALDNEKLDFVYSSDLGRSLQTAKILLKHKEDVPLIIDKRLREQNFGIYEGKPLVYLLRQMKRERADFTNFNPKGGEKSYDFYSRVQSFVEEMISKHFGYRVVLITHYGVIRVLLDHLLFVNKKADQSFIKNGLLTIADIDRLGNVDVKFLNRIK